MKAPSLFRRRKAGETDSAQVNLPDRASRIGMGSYFALMAKAEG